MNNKKLIKIVVPIVMVGVVVGIWFSQNKEDVVLSNSSESESEQSETALNITSVELDELKAQELPIIIDFGADSCVPCKEMAPVLEKLNAELEEEAVIKFVDVWKNPEAATGFPVQVIPTQVFYNADGTPYTPSEELASSIEFTQYQDQESGEVIYTVHQGGLTEEQMRAILEEMGVS